MLYDAFRRYVAEQGLMQNNQHLLLAVSGGLDSVVLCHCCHTAGYKFTLAHCNFRLRGAESDRDEAFVRSLGERYGAKVWVQSFDTLSLAAAKKISVETMARELRYTWFHQLLGEDPLPEADAVRPQLILTAHHADDNIETLTMHFFRGTGLAGLKGMEPRNGALVRPLLFARRHELEKYALDNGLTHVTDSTNTSVEYTRNYFRHRVLPLVQEVYPAADENLLNNIPRFRDAYMLYRESVERHLRRLVTRQGDEVMIPVALLRRLPARRTLLFEIIRGHGFSARQTDEVLALLDSETGRQVSSHTHRVIRHRRWLIISPVQTEKAHHISIDQSAAEVHFPGGKLHLHPLSASGWKPDARPDVADLDAAGVVYPLILRPWKTGDYFYPLGTSGKKKISRFLTDLKLSLPEKENTWVLESGGRIMWVVGRRIDHRFRITPSSKAILRLKYECF